MPKSSRPVLAVDIDDVLVPHESLLVEQVRKHVTPDYPFESMYELKLSKQPEAYRNQLIELLSDYLISDEFFRIGPIKEAAAALTRLKRRYHLVIASARPVIIKMSTQQWLQQHFPDTFRDIGFVNVEKWGVGHTVIKDPLLEQLGADILIDDSLRHITSAAANGISGILFGDYTWNQTDKLPDGVKRAKDWRAVEEILL
jgi:5'(3')-deoxyribonucleotidase